MNLTLFIQYLPILEVGFFNMFSIYSCCHKRYSPFRTVLVLAAYTAFMLAFFIYFSEVLSFRGDGRLMLGGLFYLLIFHFLYKERLSLLLTITCTCWVYTMGIFSLSVQLAGLFSSGNILVLLLSENLLFLVTIYPFYHLLIPKYIFVAEHIKTSGTRWYKYIALNNCLTFLTLAVLHASFIAGPASAVKLLTLLSLLAATHLSYYVLYKILLDSIRMNRLEYTALHDVLTGLGNGVQLWDDLQTRLKTNQTFSVLFMDLDHFKQINDRYGHMTGDLYLKHFARITSEALWDSGRLYHFGGDEFVAVYDNVVPSSVITDLKKCTGWDTNAPCPFNQVSIGSFVCRPPHTQDVESVLHQVDRMMYAAKSEKNS